MSEQILKAVYVRGIRELTLKFWESVKREELVPVMESKALDIIAEIKAVLDNEALNDPECFQKIEAIVETFHKNGLSTFRHDWG